MLTLAFDRVEGNVAEGPETILLSSALVWQIDSVSFDYPLTSQQSSRLWMKRPLNMDGI